MTHSWHEGTVGRYIEFKDGNTSTARNQLSVVSNLPSEKKMNQFLRSSLEEDRYTNIIDHL
jgi:hypothetical protein